MEIGIGILELVGELIFEWLFEKGGGEEREIEGKKKKRERTCSGGGKELEKKNRGEGEGVGEKEGRRGMNSLRILKCIHQLISA